MRKKEKVGYLTYSKIASIANRLGTKTIGFWDDSDVGRVNLAGSEDSWREREI